MSAWIRKGSWDHFEFCDQGMLWEIDDVCPGMEREGGCLTLGISVLVRFSEVSSEWPTRPDRQAEAQTREGSAVLAVSEEFLLSGHLWGPRGAPGACNDRKALSLGEIWLRTPQGSDSRPGLGVGLKVRRFRGLLNLFLCIPWTLVMYTWKHQPASGV